MSRYFLAKKKDRTKQFILDLKPLTEFIEAPHFKMENIPTVIKLLFNNYYMTTIDLKDAYFLISIHPHHRKFLRFVFNDQAYEFICFPFDLALAPYTFTKLLSPVIEQLRKEIIACINYLDDFLILKNSEKDCLNKVSKTLNLLKSLGFVIN